MTVEWSEDLATGVVEIDAQHRELLINVAELDAATRRGDLFLAREILGYLERYAAEHFAAEERCMEAAAYPGLGEHRIAHRSFVAELRRRKAEYEASRSLAFLMLALGDWLASWLNDHVRGADAEMARHLRAARPRP